jgi:hypothetical protein
MFKILSDLSLLLRKEFDIANSLNDVLLSGVSGTWVTLDASNAGYVKRTPATATELAWPVFNESTRAGTVGWTPDVTNSKKVTVLAGKFFATTDRYYGSPVIGSPMITGGNGFITTGSEGSSTNVVAYCTKAPYTLVHLGTSYTVIDIYVL